MPSPSPVRLQPLRFLLGIYMHSNAACPQRRSKTSPFLLSFPTAWSTRIREDVESAFFASERTAHNVIALTRSAGATPYPGRCAIRQGHEASAVGCVRCCLRFRPSARGHHRQRHMRQQQQSQRQWHQQQQRQWQQQHHRDRRWQTGRWVSSAIIEAYVLSLAPERTYIINCAPLQAIIEPDANAKAVKFSQEEAQVSRL